jgi:effector-binding domain-containing protein
LSPASQPSVQLKVTDPTCVAYLPMTGPYAQLPAAFGRLYGWVAEHGLAPAGMPSGVYLTDPALGEEAARWELHAPLTGDHADAPLDACGCGIKHVPPHLVACTTYRGPYERMAPVYAGLAEWIRAHGYAICGPPEEFYRSEPGALPEATLTEIHFPVAKA